MTLVAVYLAAIVAANLSVAAFGPSISILNAFLFVGLDLTTRDRLQDEWSGHNLPARMALLIVAGGVISYLLNRDAAQIAIASTAAFVAASAVDWAIYTLLRDRDYLVRVNTSNVGGAAADSVLFPTIAFGSFLPFIVLGQFVAKVAGGFLWSLILALPQWRRAA